MKIYNTQLLRKLIIPVLKKYNRDIQINHHWLKNISSNSQKIKLNLFKHKGYWYHGKNRERKTMILFKEIISKSSTIVEVGGHIGYISVYFNNLVGSTGKVIVFEPGTNNLPYIEANTILYPQIKLVKKAIGNEIGIIEFYEDSLTGQNNSIVKDFDGLKTNVKYSYVSSEVNKVIVPITTLDHELKNTKVDFIKIDIEGGEWAAICGAKNIILNQHPALMVEIQSNENDIYDLLSMLGYMLFNDSREVLTSPKQLNGNVFCLHKILHQRLILEILPNL